MILVAGSANLDFVVRAPHIPAPGETVLGTGFCTFAGGKGANQAIACARAGGVATRMLLGLGADEFSEPIEASLVAAGVTLHVVRAPNLPTGTAFICVSDDAENAITVAPGANNALRAEHLPDLAGLAYLLLQLETPLDTVTAYALAARRAGVKVVLNAAPAQLLPLQLLACVDVLVVNEGELACISNCTGTVAECLDSLHSLYSQPGMASAPCMVVTLGSRGCCARQAGVIVLQAAFTVQPVDTTAAGDTFCGVLAAGLAQQQPLAWALKRASAAAAIACTRPGAQTSIPTGTEVEQFLAAQPVNSQSHAKAVAALASFAGFTSFGL